MGERIRAEEAMKKTKEQGEAPRPSSGAVRERVEEVRISLKRRRFNGTWSVINFPLCENMLLRLLQLAWYAFTGWKWHGGEVRKVE